MDKHITVPMKKETVATLKAGDYVYLTGTVYTARDAAHKRMYEILQEGGELPIDIQGQVIYYMGPSPAREGRPIGSAGPTTASRMDKYMRKADVSELAETEGMTMRAAESLKLYLAEKEKEIKR